MDFQHSVMLYCTLRQTAIRECLHVTFQPVSLPTSSLPGQLKYNLSRFHLLNGLG